MARIPRPFEVCPYCETRFRDKDIPQKCKNTACKAEFHFNPVTVALALQPVVVQTPSGSQARLVGVRRGIDPFIGELALPGGFQDCCEDYLVTAGRELREETNVSVFPGTEQLFWSQYAVD